MRRLVVISDLHIGGSEHPMLGHPEVLTDFLGQLAEHAAHLGRDALELVVAGDFIDFLAEAPGEAWTASESAASTPATRRQKRTLSHSLASTPMLTSAGIERVAQPVAEEVERQHQAEDSEPRPHRHLASSSLRRWPIAATPISLRSSDVSFGSTSQSISLSRKAGT